MRPFSKTALSIKLFFIIGWFINIYALLTTFTTFSEITPLNVLQIIGVFTGSIGSVVGYISLFTLI